MGTVKRGLTSGQQMLPTYPGASDGHIKAGSGNDWRRLRCKPTAADWVKHHLLGWYWQEQDSSPCLSICLQCPWLGELTGNQLTKRVSESQTQHLQAEYIRVGLEHNPSSFKTVSIVCFFITSCTYISYQRNNSHLLLQQVGAKSKASHINL